MDVVVGIIVTITLKWSGAGGQSILSTVQWKTIAIVD